MTIDESIRELVRAEVARALAELRPPADEYLATVDAAALAAVTSHTIRRWIRGGRLAGHRAGREVRVRRADLERLLRDGGPRSSELTPEELAKRDFG